MTAKTNAGTVFGLFCVNPESGIGTYQQEPVGSAPAVSGSGTVILRGVSSLIAAVGPHLALGGTSNGTSQGAGNVFQESLPVVTMGTYSLG
jgi:hypothetical protein